MQRFLLLLLLPFALSGCIKDLIPDSVDFFYEEIPGSKHHGPNGTWWGYNQSKIVRHGEVVYMYVVENDNLDTNQNPNAANPSKLVIYRKEGDGAWQEGAGFNTSRPGNILIDTTGVVHLIVFEPTYTDQNENGSYGRLKHYWFPDAATGNITSYQEEIIIDNDGKYQGETVNIRVGASIGRDGTIVVSFGLNRSHQVWYLEPGWQKWQMEYAGYQLGSDYYYPYVLAGRSGTGILAIQDDWTGENQPTLYQKTHYFERSNGTWSHESMADLSSHALAPSRPQLVENSDIYEDDAQRIHLIYQTRTDPGDPWLNTFIHATREGSGWMREEISLTDKKTSWIRMLEIDGEMYYFCSSWDKLYFRKGDTGKFTRLKGPDIDGIYLYLAAPRGGTSADEAYIDLLLLNGNGNNYPHGKNYYVRIEKEAIRERRGDTR